jgi:hypothetical protein
MPRSAFVFTRCATGAGIAEELLRFCNIGASSALTGGDSAQCLPVGRSEGGSASQSPESLLCRAFSAFAFKTFAAGIYFAAQLGFVFVNLWV